MSGDDLLASGSRHDRAPETHDDEGGGPPAASLALGTRPQWRRRGYLAAWVVAILLALFVGTVAWLAVTAPLSRSLEPYAPPSITLVSADGKVIAREGANIDAPVTIATLPAHVPEAFLAIEDRRFYSHWGIDPRGILRAFWANLRAGGVRQGGSTITQQLAKGAFLTADRTASRKLSEVLIAFWLEAWLTKDQILERYLSNVYFGDNVYGLRAAAHHYFNRRPENLTVAQAAMLAGLLKAPSRLAPTVNLKGARERAALVTQAMVDAGFLNETERAALKPARLDVQAVPESISGTYFTDWILPEARDRAGSVYGEQTVTTTLDSRLQRTAERAIRRASLGGAQAAVVMMRPDGAVLAMVGGKSYRQSAFNRATQARRQPGSTFKLFVYLAALRAGMTPDDSIDDVPITAGDYRPANDGGRYRGRITLRQAFALSSNVAAVRLAQKLSVDAVIRAARDLGVTAPLPDNLSVALGSSGMSLLELTQAYAAVAAGSYPVRAHGLPEQERSWYTSLLDRPKSFDGGQLAMLRELLSAAANEGTGRRAALGTHTFGKTGTTQDNRDAIFVGYAGGLVTAVWIGNDDNSPLPGVSGGGLPARLWREIMAEAVEPRAQKSESAPVEAANAMGEALNAAANMVEAADTANAAAEPTRDVIRLRGAGDLSIDIPATPAPPPPPPLPAQRPASPPSGPPPAPVPQP